MKCIQEENVIEQVNTKAEQFYQQVNKIIRTVARDCCVNAIASMSTLFFRKAPVKNYQDAIQAATDQYAVFFNKMLDQGIYLAPSQFEAMFISLAHSEEDLAKTLEALKVALAE